jgi:hypothetical protein
MDILLMIQGSKCPDFFSNLNFGQGRTSTMYPLRFYTIYVQSRPSDCTHV